MTDLIGFIGVGTMGEPMCRNLARKSGLTVLASDRDEAPLKRLAADAVKAASVEEIGDTCRTIFLSLPGGKEVEQVCLGAGGLVSRAKLGWTVVDLSTAPPLLARRLYEEFQGKAAAFADAPVAEAFGRSAADLENADVVLLVGTNLRHEVPLLHQRLLKATKKGAKVFAINPVDFPVAHALAGKAIVAPSKLPVTLMCCYWIKPAPSPWGTARPPTSFLPTAWMRKPSPTRHSSPRWQTRHRKVAAL